MLTDRNEAIQRLKSDIDADGYPALGNSEVNNLVDDNKIASVWSASTAFEIGDTVVPTAAKRTGSKYRAIAFNGEGVSSGTTEPNWSASRDSIFSDGNITWQEDGRQPRSLWDLEEAAYQGLLKKAAKTQTEFDYGDADHKQSASQMHKMLLEQAERMKPVRVA